MNYQMTYLTGIPMTEEAYNRTIRQMATEPLSPEAKLACELLMRRTKAKRRKEKIRGLWNTIG